MVRHGLQSFRLDTDHSLASTLLGRDQDIWHVASNQVLPGSVCWPPSRLPRKQMPSSDVGCNIDDSPPESWQYLLLPRPATGNALARTNTASLPPQDRAKLQIFFQSHNFSDQQLEWSHPDTSTMWWVHELLCHSNVMMPFCGIVGLRPE